jgi:hypothetical protein
MSDYFSFDFWTGFNHILVIIKSDSRFRENELLEYVENTVKNKNRKPIDSIIFVLSSNEFVDIKNKVLSDKILSNALTRDRKINNIVFFGFDENSELNNKQIIQGNLDFVEINQLPALFRDQGIKTLCKNNNVINIAPSGTQFLKPSGSFGKEFIRTSLMQAGDAETYFLAYTLLHFWSNKKVDYIFIDTMAISPAIYKLIQIKKDLNSKICVPRIISFHSYKGFSDVPRRNMERSLVFISASTSGQMARKIIGEWQISPDRVLTFLSFKDAPHNSHLLKKISLPQNSNTSRENDLSTIPIVGEYFVPKNRKPKEVLLSVKHTPKGFSTDLVKIYKEDVFDLHRNSRIIYINSEKLIISDDFVGWLNLVLTSYAPAHISHIVYVDDESSKKIALKCLDFYKIYLNKSELPTIISDSELGTNQSNNSKIRNVLVVSSTISRGNSLLSISRDLRNFAGNDNVRIFIVGLLLSNSIETYNSLKSNLIHSSGKVNHSFHGFINFTVNLDKELNTWEKEQKLLSSPKFDQYERVKQRRNIISNTSNGLGENCFWPDLNKNNLVLREGFAFWKFKYKNAPSATVYLTIASVLQRARENNDLSAQDRLYSDEYQSAILSPECFSRFNDGIIQSSILRAARPSELDYSISPDASLQMRMILIKIIKSAKSKFGEALPEFIISLAIGHLRLLHEDLEEIYKEIKVIKLDDEFKFLEDLVNDVCNPKNIDFDASLF